MKKFLFLSLIVVLFSSCFENPQADLIVTNAKIYSLDENNTVFDCMVIDSGKIVAIGRTKDILQKWESANVYNGLGKVIYPGFIDAHCHFYGLGTNYYRANLLGINSWEKTVDSLVSFSKKVNSKWIQGRGWDQNIWIDTNMPNKTLLDKYFPEKPVFLFRIDGHAAVCNSAALRKANITANTKIEGGKIVLENGEPNGLLIDNAVELVQKVIPALTIEEKITALNHAQKTCFQYGLTTVDDAGLNVDQVLLIDSLQKAGFLKMKVYAMLNPNEESKNFVKQNGIYKSERLHVRSFKIYADGALGSRGALLKKEYKDESKNHGLLLTPVDSMKAYAEFAYKHQYQVNTHCIGDSANHIMLNLYGQILKDLNDLRWRIEHAQVIDSADFDLFRKYTIIPSVQPTHATSDMAWARKRLGEKRLKNAYAYQKLYAQNKILAGGSDFPVEGVNPILGFYAAVFRKSTQQNDTIAFEPENALTRLQALRAMTNWNAMANFEEAEKGVLEIGKMADFVVVDNDLFSCKENEVLNTRVLATFINGELVFEWKK